MLKDTAMKYYFAENFNCAETIIRAANEYYNLSLHEKDMIMVAGFGAGMQSGNTCGALLGGISVLSLMYVESHAHDSADIRPVTQLYIRKFKEALGSTLCKEIKPVFFKPEIRCQNTVETACDALEATIEEYNKKKAE